MAFCEPADYLIYNSFWHSVCLLVMPFVCPKSALRVNMCVWMLLARGVCLAFAWKAYWI